MTVAPSQEYQLVQRREDLSVAGSGSGSQEDPWACWEGKDQEGR